MIVGSDVGWLVGRVFFSAENDQKPLALSVINPITIQV